MRLDHLLSKELLLPSGSQSPDRDERSRRDAHGWNIDIGLELNLEISVRRRRQERIGRGGAGHARCWVLKDRAASSDRSWRPSGLVFVRAALERDEYRPSFENYTVDASILEKDASFFGTSLRIYKMI